MSVLLFAGDTFPTRLTYKVKKQPVPITGYSFTLKIAYPTAPLAKTAVILDQATNLGQFEFRWLATDLVEGNYPAEILTTYPDGTEKTDRLENLRIAPRIC